MACQDKENRRSISNIGTSSQNFGSRKLFGGAVNSLGLSPSSAALTKNDVYQSRTSPTTLDNKEDFFYCVDEDHNELRIRKESWELLKTEIQQHLDTLNSDNEALKRQLDDCKRISQLKIDHLESSIYQLRCK